MLFATATLAACAAIPDDSPVVEQLDIETCATITRIGRPMELYRETFMADPAGRFAFLGPFETNQMGTRELFLWVAIPVEVEPNSVPLVTVNGKTLALGTPGRDAAFAGVGKSPYKIPSPWSAMYYFKIDASVVAALGGATDLSVQVLESTKAGTVSTLFAAKLEPGDTRLKDFAGTGKP